jgi:metal-responsive CopG/Arc/MetJ family transcriptional regulator
MYKKGKRNNLNVSLDARLIEAIDEYWHRKRLASRTAAIRELLEQAIRANAVDDDKPPVDKPPRRDA